MNSHGANGFHHKQPKTLSKVFKGLSTQVLFY
jgi:hypothetical protein